jgi:hypothetical protein
MVPTRLVAVGWDRRSTRPVAIWRNATDVGGVNAEANSWRRALQAVTKVASMPASKRVF